ncbi:hypothetical protein DPMN_060744 [Dreissena polymorpha]|uniref:Uncharacterized protein n=1 Tax=Dreissena polymorpha TaxID=45954 RepID=A0A9D4HHV2_DREPO|nr:hypothetical protein DPMN_060744 [Dreissena polymorpha]
MLKQHRQACYPRREARFDYRDMVRIIRFKVIGTYGLRSVCPSFRQSVSLITGSYRVMLNGAWSCSTHMDDQTKVVVCQRMNDVHVRQRGEGQLTREQ